jgi:hypothetical protein
MINYNGQLPPDAEFDSIVPQTMNTTSDKVEKKAFDTRNYLDFSIPDGQKSVEKVIRLLPININGDKGEMFQIVHLHNIPVNKELSPNKSGKKAYMCLNAKNTGVDHEKYGSKCPVCEAQQELWKQWHAETDPIKKKAIIKEINQLDIREYCIVRCIERGKENEGPKFWRIPLRQDQTDAYHKIILLAKTRHDEGLEAGVNINIYSLYEGRDLIVTFTDGTGAPTIVDKGISTPITKDGNLLNEWYYHEKKWSDVFSTKPYDYLKLAFEGEVPWYDKVNKCWVRKTDFDSTKTTQENVIENNIKNAETQFVAEMPVATPTSFTSVEQQQIVIPPSVDDDDLPF